jgi:hypothetical protein
MPLDNDPGGNRDQINALRAAQRSKKKQQVEQRCRMQLVASLVCTVIAFTASLNLDVPDALPMHTSMLTGQMWLNELLAGHPDRFKHQIGMAKHVFYRLSFELQAFSGLVSTKFVTADEKLAIFLHFARTGCSTQILQQRFQRSADTISRYLFFILSLISSPNYSQIYLYDSENPCWPIL